MPIPGYPFIAFHFWSIVLVFKIFEPLFPADACFLDKKLTLKMALTATRADWPRAYDKR